LDIDTWAIQLLVRFDFCKIKLPLMLQLPHSVNAHAEELRSQFVEHEGQKELVVTATGTRYTVDFGEMANAMTGEIHKNVRPCHSYPVKCTY
jgi:hypothetical protein